MSKEIKDVVIRFSPDGWWIAYANSYQSAFRSSVNSFKDRADAVQFIKDYNKKKGMIYTLNLIFHEHDQLRHEVPTEEYYKWDI